MKYIYLTFIVISLSIYSVNAEGTTIGQIKNDIEVLYEEKEELSIESKALNHNNRLESFFRKNLNPQDLGDIRDIITNYLERKNSYNKILNAKILNGYNTQGEKDALLIIKKDLYQNLLPYIDVVQIDEYLEYIRGDAQISKQYNEVSVQITEKQNELNFKVSNLEKKIKEYNNYINLSFERIIEQQVDKKIMMIQDNSHFRSLSTDSKKKILISIIQKVERKKSELMLSDEENKQLLVLNIFLDRINLFLLEL